MSPVLQAFALRASRATTSVSGIVQGSAWARGLILVLIVSVLELLVFRSYLLGRAIPPWDFLGSYNTDAYLWWSAGGFFNPIDWVPHVWAGYPAALNLQNSAWYLPVGISSLLAPYSLHSAAVLAALHVAFGFLGTFVLVRRFGSAFPVAVAAAVAGFFAVGYFSNAEHVDIARAYAWLPWLLLVFSPKWPWRRLWAIPVATVIVWQAVAGMYPGIVVAIGYVAIVWVAFWQWRTRARIVEFLLPLGITAVASVLLSLPRLLPYVLMQQDAASGLPETSEFSYSMVGTLLFGYSSDQLPNDISMRSFFVPATMLVLLLFARWRDDLTRAGLALVIPALALGMPFLPWYGLVQSLPGLGLSRFTMSDFKVLIVLGIILIGASGFTALRDSAERGPLPRRQVAAAIGAVVLVVVFAAIGILGPFTLRDWAPGLVILAVAVTAVLCFARFGSPAGPARAVFSVAVIALTALSGGVWAYTTTAPWMSSRVESEAVTYGETVDELLSRHVDYSDDVRRPARLEPADGYDIDKLFSVEWNRVFYTGEYAVGGYLNLKGSATEQQLQAALLDDDSGEAFSSFLAAPGSILTATPTPSNLEACGSGIDCGDVEFDSLSYAPGEYRYQITADKAATALLNEAYFQGWEASVCQPDLECTALPVARDPSGLVQVDLPRGEYVLELEYRTPGRTIAWALFGLGALLACAAVAVLALRRRSGPRQFDQIGNREQHPPRSV